MDRWKAEQGRGREKRKIRREKSRRERARRKKMQMRDKVGKPRNTVFFQWFGAPEGRKVGSLKRRVRSQLARWEMKNCTPLWREEHFQVKMHKAHKVHFWKLRCRKSAHRCGAKHISKSKCTKHTMVGPLLEVEMSKSARRCGAKHISKSKCTKHYMLAPLLEVQMSKTRTLLWREAHFEIKMYKTPGVRTTFGSWDVEKVHAVVARSTFRSQNVQNTTCWRHFWKFRCRKSARRCGAKQISESKCTKHQGFGPLLEVEMSKKCTALWREAHFQVKMYKTPGVRTTFGSWDVERVHAVVARSTFRSQNVQNTTCWRHFWRFRCRKSARRCGAKHISKSKCTKHQGFGPLFGGWDVAWLYYTTLHYITLHSTTRQPQLHNYTQLHSTTLNYTPLHSTTLKYTPLHYTTFHYTSLHYIALHSTPLQLHNYTTTQLHSTTLHYTPLHSTTLHYTLRYTTLHYITLHSATPHYTTLHYTTLHYTEWHCTADRQVDR